MNDLLEAQLTDRLHRLAEEVELPQSTPEDDVRRGQGRLRRRRALTVAGSGAAVAALVGAGFAVTGSAPTADRAIAPPAVEQPASERRVPDRIEKERLESSRDDQLQHLLVDGLVGEVVAESKGTYRLSYLLAATEALEDELGARSWVKIGVGEAASWKASGAPDCPAGWTCEDVDVRGADRARLATSDTVSQVVVEFPEQVLIVSLSTEDRPADGAYTGTTSPNTYFLIKGS
jgi:hypothetical protein